MSVERPSERREAIVDVLDWCFFVYSGVAAGWLAYVLARDGAHAGWQLLLLVVFWGFVAYLLLPRLHGILTAVYVPDYFIGRTRTSDGLLGDPVNLGFHGREDQVHTAFATAGWTRADDLGPRASWHIVRAVLARRSYREAPVSPLHLFGRQQDFAYQQEVASSPSRRHHVRLWRCPGGWLLPGGFPVDWLGAATYDRRVGLSLFTLQITHKIDQDIDVERDLVVQSLTSAGSMAPVRTIQRFASGYHSRNGGGDVIRTDGDLPIVDLRMIPVGIEGARKATDSRDRRPATISVGAGLTLLRAVSYLVLAATILIAPDEAASFGNGQYADLVDDGLAAISVGVLMVMAAIDATLALAVLRGSTLARLWLMTACALAAALGFVDWLDEREPVGVIELPVLGSSILVLLALSSPRAREWSRRRRGGLHITTRRATPA